VAGGTGTSYADGATYPFGAATTLYAQWTASGGGGASITLAPVITGISPARGSTAGGTKVSITGSNFGGATIVKFGAVTAIDVIVVNSSTITAASPAGTAGLVNVTVTIPGGTSSASFADDFTYVSAVSITLIQGSPSSATVADGGGYSGQRAVTNGTGTISYSETTSWDSSYVVVTSTGAISAATSLSPGTYSVSGNDSDTNGDTGSWTFSLTVIIPPTPAGTASVVTGNVGGARPPL
jgi:large repetitive protein